MLPFLAALAPFAPIIGGAIGAVGSLMGPKPKPQTVTNSIDLKRLRKDADEAGFNPLTIIRGGGLAGYGTSVQSAAPDMRFSNALSTFGSGVAQWDPFGVLERQASIKVAEAQIAHWAKQGAPANMSLQTPKAEGVGDPYTVFGIELQRSPWFSDAEVIETRHGGIADAVYGGFTIPADMIYTGWKNIVGAPKANADIGAVVRDATGRQFSIAR